LIFAMTKNVHATLMIGKRKSFLEINGCSPPTEDYGYVRVTDELGISQAEAARASNCSTARFGNYVTGTRNPDLETLARIATALRTTTDWLLGLSDAAPVDIEAVLRRILELDGMPAPRAAVIAQAAEEALRLLASLPSGGDAQTRALLAAQAAWQLKSRPTIR
jgi:transcriptional regulator with XRE-family HTH domain